MKVVEVVPDKRASGWSAQLIQENYPGLSLSQIYAARPHYEDHRDVIDRR